MAALLIRSIARTIKRPPATASAAYSTGGGRGCTCTRQVHSYIYVFLIHGFSSDKINL
ncbi:BnaC02g36320D [Brassica napus]|uniref:BnaC02g36320D protein n=1 Tax=Brassica napus TaxID=3708 RepID=A0A078GV78_BRANA|nr:BnaC02g36320D [Brassica napus]